MSEGLGLISKSKEEKTSGYWAGVENDSLFVRHFNNEAVNIEVTEEWKNEKRNGLTTAYHENGTLMLKVEFENDEILEGKEEYFNEDGEKIEINT